MSDRPPPDERAAEDAGLVAEALAGSSEAYRILVERYQRPVLGLVARMVRDPGLAEDLAQEAFVRAFRNLHRFDPSRSFRSWLFKIAHNRTIDHLRIKSPPTVALEVSSADGEDSWEVLEAADDEGPHRRAEGAELRRALAESIAALGPRYREVILLRFQGGLAYHEIAEATGQTMGSVKVLLHRARKKLAAELEKRGQAAPEAFSG
ncbi:MAG: sigma-70 family RNA polymerase sigma factor [Holophagales bacterium]|nr:sigma-70 family RNA polymerase sigma factor [Holophagales bacterium]